MSQENVELVERSLNAFSQRDTATLRVLNHRDLELDWSASRGLQATVYRGFERALHFYDEYFEAFEEIVVEIDRVIEIGDVVIVSNVSHQRGRDGIEVSARSALVFTVAGRQIIRLRLYQDLDEAIAAPGFK
jgi:ketosteroid isomerase-like protein